MKSFVFMVLSTVIFSASTFASEGQCVDGKCLLAAPVKVAHKTLTAVVESKPVQAVNTVVTNTVHRTACTTKKVLARPGFLKRKCR